jgi:predicted RNA polymerase sigma factor
VDPRRPAAEPGGWITTTARNRAVDRLRRDQRGRELHVDAVAFDRDDEPSEGTGPVPDDRLRLIFTCCHPALSPGAQIAFTLRLLGGLSTGEVATAFLVPEPTMAKRLVRAEHEIKAARIPYRVPSEPDLLDRMSPLLAVPVQQSRWRSSKTSVWTATTSSTRHEQTCCDDCSEMSKRARRTPELPRSLPAKPTRFLEGRLAAVTSVDRRGRSTRRDTRR